MRSSRFWTQTAFLAAISCLAILASGCSTIGLTDASISKPPGQASESVTDSEQPTGALITMEIRAAGKEPEMRQMPLAGVTRVQQALEQLGATKRFRRMDVLVMRPAKGQRQRLEVKYDHAKRSVNPLYDYVLHPGDHLVVTEDTTTAFDDMLGSITGSVGLPTVH